MKYCLTFLIFLNSCCQGGYQIGESNISIQFPEINSSFNYGEIYPRLENSTSGTIPNYEKNGRNLKIKFLSIDIQTQKEYKIYLNQFNGKVIDSIEQVKFAFFEKDRCKEGLNVSLKHKGILYSASENRNLKY